MSGCGMQELVNDYVEGLLSGDARQEFEHHLSTCPACQREVEETRALLADAAALPRSIEPPRDLWPEVEARIGPRGIGDRSLRSMKWALAAAAVLLVLVSSATTAILTRPVGMAEAGSGDSEAVWSVVESQYLRASADLQEALEIATPGLPPAVVERIEENLRVIDSAILDSRAALAADPTNASAREFLSSAYEKKLEVLRQVTQISARI